MRATQHDEAQQVNEYCKYVSTKGQQTKPAPAPAPVRNSAYPLHQQTHTSQQYQLAANLAGNLSLA